MGEMAAQMPLDCGAPRCLVGWENASLHPSGTYFLTRFHEHPGF
jgi:hypothetical protein